MGALGNFDHERFCQALHKRRLTGEKAVAARRAAYLETIYTGKSPDDPSIIDNARRLVGQKQIKGRLQELADYSAAMAGIDSSWAMLKLKGFADGTADFTQEEIKHVADENGELVLAERKVKVRAYDPIAAQRLMAEIGGWKAPAKVAATDPTGEHAAPIQVIEIVRFATPDPDAKDQASA